MWPADLLRERACCGIIGDMSEHQLDPSCPFLTTELLALRASQRRFQASVPDWLLERVKPSRPAIDPEAPPHPERTELLVRRLLQNRLEETKTKDTMEPFTDLGGLTNTARGALPYLLQWLKELGDDGRLDGLHQSLVKSAATRGPIAIPQEIAFELFPVVAELSALSDLADALARDGYRDPRIPRQASPDYPRDNT